MTVGQSMPPRATIGFRADAERRAHDHEHARLYDALERAAQLAELAGHDTLAVWLRTERRDVAREIDSGECSARRRPAIFLASDDVDTTGLANEWNAAGLARAAGERDDA